MQIAVSTSVVLQNSLCGRFPSLRQSTEHVNCLDIHIEDNHVNNVASDTPAINAASDAVADDAFFCFHK